MKVNFLLSGLLLLIFNSLHSQDGLYLGYEGGVKWNKFMYVNEKGFHGTNLDYTLTTGGYLGYKHQNFTLESGLQWFEIGSPIFWFNYHDASVKKYDGDGNQGNPVNYLVIPLRIGYDFMNKNHQFFLKPEMGFLFYFVQHYRYVTSPHTMGGGSSIDFDQDEIGYPSETEYTYSEGYIPDNFSLGFESSLCAGYRFHYRADIYLKISIHSSLDILYYETITHHMDSGDVTATHSFSGNSLSCQIGLRGYLGKRKQTRFWLRE